MHSTLANRASSLVGRLATTRSQIVPRMVTVRRSQNCSRHLHASQAARQELEPATTRAAISTTESQPLRSLTEGLEDPPPRLDENEKQVDWTRSFHGLSATPFTDEQAAILQQELSPDDIEVKPDGIVYLPEIKYRRILNKAFKPGGWGLAPRGETIITQKLVTREYGLVAAGRLISISRGEQQYFDPDGIPTATEGCKSNALMRCCKDLGIASELWDPRWIQKFLKQHARETFVEHQISKKRRKHWLRKEDSVRYPFTEVSGTAAPRAVFSSDSTPKTPTSTAPRVAANTAPKPAARRT